MERDLALVLASDERSALPLAVAVRSALAHTSALVPVEVFVLDTGLSEESRARLVKVAAVVRPHVPLYFTPVPLDRLIGVSDGVLPHASWARLLLADLLPERVSRAVYLDADVLVRRDLSPLFMVKLGGAPVAAVSDFLEHSSPYFNAGVLAIDVERWRRESLGDRALRCARVAEPPITDQAALNQALEGRWHELDHRWNVQHGNLFFAGYHGLVDRPRGGPFTDGLQRRRWQLYRGGAILHFVGGTKPWDRLCPLPGTTAWVRTMVRTRWHAHGEAARWVGRYVFARSRYWLGITRRRFVRAS